MKRCYSCFKKYSDSFSVCPFCGQIENLMPIEPIHLTPGTIINKRYILGQAIGSGGFGIVYRAYDSKLETIVAIKEFFVSRIMTRAEGLKNVIVSQKSKDEYQYRKARFLAEARTMAKFGGHRSIPNVFDVFEENNTAYIVMELLEGMTLNEYMNQSKNPIKVDFAVFIANEVGKALKSLHNENIIHRDVAPDNIFICTGKEIRVKLMDLGAAKLANSTDDVIDIILKPGYSPPEQYDNTKNIGPWSDIYALGATMYMMLTRRKPDESTNRKIKDEVVPAKAINPKISENLNNTIMKSIAVEKHMRFKTIDDFLLALNGEKKIVPLEKEKKRRKKKRAFGIIAACLVLSIVSGVVFNQVSDKYRRKHLPHANIDLMYKTEYDKWVRIACENFKKEHEGIEIVYRSFTDEEYEKELKEALKNDDRPALFWSTGVAKEITDEYGTELKELYESDSVKKCEGIKKFKDYTDIKKLPLAINIPVSIDPANYIYNKKGWLETDKDIIVDIDLNNGNLVRNKFESAKKRISINEYISMNIDERREFLFVTSAENYCRNLDKFEKLRKEANYSPIYPSIGETVFGEFSFEWSISRSLNENEKIVAESLLEYFVINTAVLVQSPYIPIGEKGLIDSIVKF